MGRPNGGEKLALAWGSLNKKYFMKNSHKKTN
jgi:hypothetical protein